MEVRFSHWQSVAVAISSPPVILIVPALVSPLSPNAEISPPLMLIAVSACTASFPHLMTTSPPERSTLPFVDLIPSPSDLITSLPPLTVTEDLPFTASFASSVLRVSILVIPPVNLISLLQTIAGCVLAVMVSTPVPLSPPLTVRSSLASITALFSLSPVYAAVPSDITFSVPSAIVIEVLSAFLTSIAGALLPVILTPLKISLTVPLPTDLL